MKLVITAALILTPMIAHADSKAGEKKAQVCLLCHKPNNPMAYVPTLEGQTREYIYLQTKAYKEKRRPDPVMQTNVATLSEQDMRDIADYFASRKPIRANVQVDPQKVSRGQTKAKELNCGACHKPDFSGQKEVPRLAGLEPKYIGPQIVAFKAMKRAHPPVSGMSALTDADAENLAQYFAQLE
jgi:cytochrome c553